MEAVVAKRNKEELAREESNKDDRGCLVDPVCQMHINHPEAAATANHEGIAYFFCSDNCQQQFVADPEKYLVTK